jgi:hypothetical protein
VKRRITIAILAFGLAGAIYCGIVTCSAIWKFTVEDSIHGTFYPVIVALDKYCDDHGYAPEALRDLRPKYIKETPSSPYVSDIIYRRVPKEPAWRLTLVSRATISTRQYIAEDGLPLSAEERKVCIRKYHERWSVLKTGNAEQVSSPNAR